MNLTSPIPPPRRNLRFLRLKLRRHNRRQQALRRLPRESVRFQAASFPRRTAREFAQGGSSCTWKTLVRREMAAVVNKSSRFVRVTAAGAAVMSVLTAVARFS